MDRTDSEAGYPRASHPQAGRESQAAREEIMSKKGKNTQAAPEAENTQAAPEAKMTRSVVPQKYRAQYGKAASCGDALAAMMKGADIVEVAQANGIDLDRWAGKNPGMIRMNLGNVLRGRVKRNEPVFIAGKQIN